MCISCRPHVGVHKGEGGPVHVDACGQGEGSEIFVDVINGCPLLEKEENFRIWKVSP